MDGTARRARLARSRLYFVLEARPHGGDPSDLLDAALRGGVDLVQLRDKELPDDELVRASEPFRRACAAHGALFVLNDRPELVDRCGADGVHVGQGDASVADARRAVGADRLVGLSAGTREELEAASGDADYLGVGAIFGTPTKPDADIGGLELVRAARDLLRVPCVQFATPPTQRRQRARSERYSGTDVGPSAPQRPEDKPALRAARLIRRRTKRARAGSATPCRARGRNRQHRSLSVAVLARRADRALPVALHAARHAREKGRVS